MNFQHLRFAVAVAETRSFTRAADLCCVTQPALSNAIVQLENELGERLFERTTRSVELTEFGEIMIARMNDIIAARLTMLSAASDYVARNNQVVRLGMSPLISAEYSAAVLSRAEKVGLKVVVTEMNKADIEPALQSGIIDYGLCPAPQLGSSFEMRRLYAEPLFVISDATDIEGRASVSLADVAHRKFLMVADACGLSDTAQTLFQEEHLEMNAYEGRALAYHVLEHWAHLGIGVTILPASKVTKPEYALPLKAGNSAIASLQFYAHWQERQAKRPNFQTILACFGPENPPNRP